MSDIRITGKWFEELEVGLVVPHAVRRTVTETDNLLFTCLTMNTAPLHLDVEYAKESEFGQVLVNSMFTIALLVGLGVSDLTQGTTVANLGFERVTFPKPVFMGDTIRAETEVVASRPSNSRPREGLVTFEHRASNQRDEIVAIAQRVALMHRRPTE